MIIKSRFRDYYDYVAHAYGSGDPKIVYMRDYVIPDKRTEVGNQEEAYLSLTKEQARLVPDIPKITTLEEDELRKTQQSFYKYRLLVVAGRLYYLGQLGYYPKPETEYRYTLLTVTKDWHVVEPPDSTKRRSRPANGTLLDSLLSLCREVKAPVFIIEQDLYASSYSDFAYDIHGRVPQLARLGFADYMPAEQLYQELSLFVGNTINENPDMMPKVPMTDIQKVESHGFDKKQSFRHRK